MKSLDNLIRLHKWQLDEKRRNLAELEKLREALQLDLVKLAADLAREGALADTAGDGTLAAGTLAFPGWMAATLARRDKINASIVESEQRILTAKEEVGEAFAEVKRYEQVAEARDRRARDSLNRRLAAEMDEAGLEGHRRKALALAD